MPGYVFHYSGAVGFWYMLTAIFVNGALAIMFSIALYEHSKFYVVSFWVLGKFLTFEGFFPCFLHFPCAPWLLNGHCTEL